MEKLAETGTIVGYDCLTKKVLFTETNRVLTNPDQAYALPHGGDYYRTADGKNYFIVGIRGSSTPAAWQMDVLQELPIQEHDRAKEDIEARNVHNIVELNLSLGEVKRQIRNCLDRLNIATDPGERSWLSALRKGLEARRDALTNEIKRIADETWQKRSEK